MTERSQAYVQTFKQQVEARQPKFVVYVNVSTSWILQPDTDRRILQWFLRYVESDYEQVGLIDILGPQDTRYYWGREQSDRKPESNFWLTVYERS